MRNIMAFYSLRLQDVIIYQPKGKKLGVVLWNKIHIKDMPL